KKKNISFSWLFRLWKREPTDVRKREAHSRVHESLTELRVLVRCSRGLIFQFHNGGKFADGTSIKRFSITHESCSNGITSMMLESQDVLLTRYMELVDLLDKKSNHIIAVSSLPHCSFRSILEINNVVYFCLSPLKCQDSLTPMGFVCCHWCDYDELDKMHEEEISDSALQEVIENTTRIINNHLLMANK
ncbi:MAG: hypothetical protein EB127_06110, partial [Alphaproteobacteria bacterium]|nr:hypothetical protein [Alphaproteobacteria bacterium]